MQDADPFLDTGMRGFIFNTARKHYWRVASWYEFDDLVQDGYLCYAKCKAKYSETVTEKRHFMSLVQVSFLNHISTLASKRTATEEVAVSHLAAREGEDGADLEKLGGSTPESASFLSLVSGAPEEFKQLILLLADDVSEVTGFKRKSKVKHRRRFRESTNEYFCRLLGKDPQDENVVEQLRAYFG